MSRIGIKAIAVPSGVKIEVRDGNVHIEGPKGKAVLKISDRIQVEVKDNSVKVGRTGNIATDRALHGMTRALINNMIIGVNQGYTKELEIIGVGFKAQVQGKKLTMALGFSHPVVFEMPEGIAIEAPKPTNIVIRGVDKMLVGEIAAKIRDVYPPEPYKGKGIRYSGEQVRKKVGKAQATSK
ncbi:MAG TPA: 50S ribosomal protein L6 [Candidatus Omnitrophota bacterium]|mgnify:CR=1 FL=1|nr:50S ribosomal protein L6 [Candidatus Omnitrophota bacterium]HNQ51376.1 50S ribosomal protein L6 [Candidatus Omnitrophota bacterium]HQO38042.1 50S ribosomal protein L6 [Candidatus Omnitrophota bacterium]HQQ05990.1 50S ribosomal protein L6 [Candidatus Omnitrophota bacterium]